MLALLLCTSKTNVQHLQTSVQTSDHGSLLNPIRDQFEPAAKQNAFSVEMRFSK
jgi:hypothetical protein